MQEQEQQRSSHQQFYHHHSDHQTPRPTTAVSTSTSTPSSVGEKINQFNSLALQSRQMERTTADAALTRAMLGREEAEGEMRRYRDETQLLRAQLQESKERERHIGERLEAVMVRMSLLSLLSSTTFDTTAATIAALSCGHTNTLAVG